MEISEKRGSQSFIPFRSLFVIFYFGEIKILKFPKLKKDLEIDYKCFNLALHLSIRHQQHNYDRYYYCTYGDGDFHCISVSVRVSSYDVYNRLGAIKWY